MPTSTCIRCGLMSDSIALSGLCATCFGLVDETQIVEGAAGTLTHDPPTPATRSAGADGAGGVLPPGGYRYVEPLGGGGMGVVWRAVRVSTGQTVAIKKLRPECFTPAGLQRFVTEARTLAAIRHANVVQLLDFVPDAADPFIVMEFVPGHSLSEQLKQSGPLHPDRAARLVAAAARGVQAAHDVAVIHRDLKPANLLLTPDGRVKVADFGLGKRLVEVEVGVPAGGASDDDEPTTTQGVTRTGQVAGGTPGFMAPEQVDEKYGRVDYTSDVWGLGACLYALLTNQSPFRGGRDNVQAVLTDSFLPPQEVNPSVPPDLAAIAVKCLQKDPGRRYRSAAAVADDLDRFVDRDSTVARPKAWPARVWRRIRQTPRAVVVAVAVAILAVIAGGSLAMIPKHSETSPTAVSRVEPESPDEIQERYRGELRAGRPVTLIGETGLPAYHTWRLGNPTLGLSWTGDGTCAFESVDYALLELFDDPGIDNYTVRMDLCQLNSRHQPPGGAPSDEGAVGLYVGHVHIADGGGGWLDGMFCIRFIDYDWQFLRTGQVEDQLAKSATLILHTKAGGRPVLGATTFAELLYTPATKRPGDWRTVEFEVGRDTIAPYWGADRKSMSTKNGPALNAPAKFRNVQKYVDGTIPGRGVTAPEWSPRRPLGVFCGSSAVAVRNVLITPH